MSKWRAVIFDLGDTLVSHMGSKTELFRRICQEANVPLPEDRRLVHAAAAAGWRDGMNRVNPLDWKDLGWREHVFRTGLTAAGIEEERERYVETLMRMKLPKPANEVMPHAFELLRDLRVNGYKLAIVSNYYGNLTEVLERTKLAPLFDAAFDSDVVGLAKPEPRIFHLACEALGVTPEEAVYVGDMPPYDAEGASRAGLHPVLLDPCGIWNEHGDYTHVRNIRSLEELPGVLLEA